MIPVELMNTWGGVWFGLMTRTLIETCALLGLILVVWLPLRRRMSAQLAHGLFCLVLLKLIIPVPVAATGWQPLEWARRVTERLSARTTLPSEGSPAGAATVSPTAPWALPATGDVGTSLAEVSSPQPVGAALQAASPGGSGARAPSQAVAARSPARVVLSIQAVLMLGWACGVTLLLVNFVRSTVRTRRLIRQAVPLPAKWLPIDLDSLGRAVGLRTAVRWAVDARLDSPAVGGLLRPAVIIPPDLNDSLTPNQLTWVLLHELAHVRRGDLWVVIFQRVVQSVFFFNPAVHLANWIIDELREYACDDAALAACKTSRRDCGEGFVAIIERSAGHSAVAAPALGLFEERMLIRRRLLRILDDQRTVHARLSRPAACGLVVLALALLVLPYGAPGTVSAGPQKGIRSVRESKEWLEQPGNGPDEPASYRPGAVWHHHAQRERSGGENERTSSSGRAVVLAVAYSPDGTILASAGDDAVIRLQDLASGQLIGRLEGHRDTVSCLAFSPDGGTLATGSYDRSLKLWDVAARRLKTTLSGHTNWVFSVAFSPDGGSLASGGHDKTVRIWDVTTGRETARLAGQSASVRTVAFSAYGGRSLLAVGGADQVVQVWDLSTMALRMRLEGHKGMIRALSFAPDGATLASGSEDGEVRLWDMDSGRLRAALAGHSDMVTCLAFSPRGGILATGSLDASVKLWETRSGRERASLQGHLDGVSALAFAPGARQMATGGFDGSVRLWEPAAPIFTPVACFPYAGETSDLAFAADSSSLRADGTAGVVRWDVRAGSAFPRTGNAEPTAVAAVPDITRYVPGGPAGRVAYSPDRRVLASAQQGGDVLLWDARSGRQLGLLRGHRDLVNQVVFSADGRSLATAGKDRTVKLWSLATRRQTARATLKRDLTPVRSLAYSPDAKTLAVADCPIDGGGTVTLWDLVTRRLKATLDEHERGVVTVVFSPDGTSLASGSCDGTIRIWEVATGKCRHELAGLSGVTELAYSPDGRLLASAGEGIFVTLWDVETGREVSRLTDLRWPVNCVAFSPDGTLLVTGGGTPDKRPGARGELKVWDVAKQSVVATLDGHAGAVLAVCFSPDGLELAAGGVDEMICLWDVKRARSRLSMGGLSGGVQALAFSPDGRTLAWSGRHDGLVSLRDATTGAEIVRFVGHTAPVRGIAFAPDGTGLASGGDDRSIKLWDVPAYEPSVSSVNDALREAHGSPR
jgi:WD40 repeat protein